jgi:tungstate transport system ATP-binding protein
MTAIFKVSNLGVNYGGKKILEEVSFSIQEGEIFAVLGPSGAGKTTLLRVLCCLEKPSSGEIFFKGVNMLKARGRELLSLRRRMAMVFQEGEVFNASVYDNVAYGLKIRGVEKQEIGRRVRDALEIVGLKGYEARNARTLSGGEKQRVTFAMAAVIRPEVLLFDEPTANLDPLNEAVIDGIIERINRLGITVILATHKQGEALTLANRVGILNKGRFEQVGTPEEIFYKPATPFVARFVGVENILEGVISSLGEDSSIINVDGLELRVPSVRGRVGDRVTLCIRPEEIMILREDVPRKREYPNVVSGRIARMSPQGKALVRLLLEVGDKGLVVDLPRHAAGVMKLEVGKVVKASLKPESCHVIPD